MGGDNVDDVAGIIEDVNDIVAETGDAVSGTSLLVTLIRQLGLLITGRFGILLGMIKWKLLKGL